MVNSRNTFLHKLISYIVRNLQKYHYLLFNVDNKLTDEALLACRACGINPNDIHYTK